MTQQITFQYAIKLLNQKEENLLEQISQVRERRAQLIGTLRFLRIPELLDFTEDLPPEAINYFDQTESSGQSPKPSTDFSSKTGPLQKESIYERPYQKARREMNKETLRPETLFPDNPHETLTGSTTLQELLDNLDKPDRTRFNQDIIREFLTDLINFGSVDKEPDNSNSVDKEPGNFDSVEKINDHWNSLDLVPGYQSTTEKIRPGTADQGSDIPIPGFRDPAAPDSDPAIPDSDIRDPNVPDSLMELKPNFQKALNLGEKMERVGIASRGKTLSPNEVTKLLIDQGQYRSRIKNIRYRVRQIMRDNTLQYEKIGEDTFRFIRPGRETPRHPLA